MRPSGFRRERLPSGERVSVIIDGFELWFESESFSVDVDGAEAVLGVSLLPAMAQGRTLDLSMLPAIPESLFASLPEIQSAWTQWNLMLQRIEVVAQTTAGRPTDRANPVTCFSGGVDATHAVLAGGEAKERLLYIDGFDHPPSPGSRPAIPERVARLAAKLDRELAVVRTNWITWRRQLKLSGGLTHGGALVACGYLLGGGQLTIPSSSTWAWLYPWGTHPLLDPLWSTPRTTIRHFGSEWTRCDKIEEIARDPSVLAEVLVCHGSPDGNCGVCAKCLRTRAALVLLGTDLAVAPDAQHIDVLAAYTRRLAEGSESSYLGEFLQLARRAGNARVSAQMQRAGGRVALRFLLGDARRLLAPRSTASRARLVDLQSWGLGPMPRLS